MNPYGHPNGPPGYTPGVYQNPYGPRPGMPPQGMVHGGGMMPGGMAPNPAYGYGHGHHVAGPRPQYGVSS